MATSINRATVPVLTNNKSYSNWKKEIAIWQLATLPEEKQEAAIFLTLTGRARETALEMSTNNTGRSKEGVKRLLAKLDELY